MRNTEQTYSLGRGSEVTGAKRSETESAHENPGICKSASAPIKWVISEDSTVIVKKEGTVPVEEKTSAGSTGELEKEFESYPCPYCEIIFTGKQYLENHLKKRHPKEYFEILRSASLNMQTWQPTLPSPNSLAVNHSEMLGNFRPSHRCTECRKSFAQINTLMRHQQTHQRGEAPCRCVACGKSFRHLGHLKTHQKTHQEHKLHRCTKCNKAFMRSGTLKIHQRTHTGETPYRCTECGKKFSQIGNLKTHLRIHKGERPFHCSECGKSFIRAGTLKIHQRIHTGEYPYLCTECGSSFKESGALKSHQRIHTGERPYPCPECGKTFRRSGTLKIHQRLHTG